MNGVFAFALVLLAFIPHRASAIPPPDVIFNIGSNAIQVIVLVFGLFSTSLLSLFKMFRKKWFPIIVVVMSLAVVAGAIITVFVPFGTVKPFQPATTGLSKENEAEVRDALNADALDQLKVEAAAAIPVPPGPTRFRSALKSDEMDVGALFMEKYYRLIATGSISQAYELSKKSVAEEIFASWYAKTTGIAMEKIQRIDGTRYSLELTLFEGAEYTRYGVLVTLALNKGRPYRIVSSTTRTLSHGVGADMSLPTTDTDAPQLAFPEIMTNEAFKTYLDAKRTDMVILDAREDPEYDIGNIPGSLHIRYADLRAGRWIELPTDKPILVLCWSGIRGRIVAEFLRSKKLSAAYLEEGLVDWVDKGGYFNGEIHFSKFYSAPRYAKIFTAKEIREAQGVTLVDAREPDRFAAGHILGAVNVSMLHMPSSASDATFSQIPKGNKIITLCDAYVNCFDASIVGVVLEKLGYEFLGRYVYIGS
jgi:rhodanese-related sulfurtransferase/uncharacterized integral membrane protein